MRVIFTIFLFCPAIAFTQNVKDSVKFSFIGEHDMTQYLYIFYINGNFKSDITGHLGNEGETKGIYSVFNDTIFVTPLPENQQLNKYYDRSNEKFLIDGDSSIIDLSILYDYRKIKQGYNSIYSSNKRSLNILPKTKLQE